VLILTLKSDYVLTINLLFSNKVARTNQQANIASNIGSNTACSGSSRGRPKGSQGRDREKGQEGSYYRVDKNKEGKNIKYKYFFCSKTGHFQKDCRKYLEAQKKVKKNIKSERSNYNKKANIAIVEKYNDSTYSQELALNIKIYQNIWLIDSEATKHFTENRSDYIQYIAWTKPRKVQIADSITVESLGFGVVKLGYTDLQNVWFIPTFNQQLLSVGILDSEEYKLVFKDRKIVCMYDLYLVFEACKNQKLYIVNLSLSTATVNEVYSGIISKSVKIEVNKLIKSKNSELYNKLAYRRLGHTNYPDIFRLSDNSESLVIYKTKPIVGRNTCEDCLAGKLKKSFVKKTDFRRLQPG